MFKQGPAFEDVLSGCLASLYAFALFMAGDHEDRAEDLLVRAVSRGFEAYLRGDEPTTALMRGLLAEARSVPARSDCPQRPLPSVSGVMGADRLTAITPGCLRRAAARIPVMARAAIWLVVVERHTYGETAEMMGIDETEVCALIEWRDTLIRYALDHDAGEARRAAGRGR